ncbi:MAG: hypothetical protein ACOX3V_04805 [Bacillota bacterium]|jgi:hypothetical protein
MAYKDSKWASQILALQHDDGSWVHFHTLSNPTKSQLMTTEQALRRLRILGFTKDDEPICCAMHYMEANLANPEPTVFHEKKHDSKTYGDLMLDAWLRLFDSENKSALSVAKKWALIIEAAFADGIHFPLSDSWRNPADRKADCTFRISRILKQLGVVV